MEALRDYLGRSVRLTRERLNHILEHPEMASLAPLLPAAIAQPELVIQSRSDGSAHLYYRLLTSTPFGAKWLCVVVKYGKDDAFVLTAYLTAQPKRGDRLWPNE